MKIVKLFYPILFLVAAFMPTTLVAQSPANCPVQVTAKQANYMNKVRSLYQQIDVDWYRSQKSMEYFIPIQIHIIRNDNGTGGLSFK